MRTTRLSIHEFRELYRQHIGELMPGGLNNRATELCHRFPRDKLEEAFTQTSAYGGHSFRYLVGVLEGKARTSPYGTVTSDQSAQQDPELREKIKRHLERKKTMGDQHDAARP